MEEYQQLQQLNEQLDEVADELLDTPAEAETTDDLVNRLQTLVLARQTMLAAVILQAKDEKILRKQLDWSTRFEHKATLIRQQRQELLSLKQQSKRQLNVYKAVDENR